jgi:hypothetical protein
LKDCGIKGQKEERKERAGNKRRKKKSGKVRFTYGALSDTWQPTLNSRKKYNGEENVQNIC